MSSCSNAAAGFVDIATLDEIEKYQYGSSQAFTYFVRETRRSTWFTQVPVLLSKSSGQVGFGREWSVTVTRSCDYMLHTWLRVKTPAVTLLNGNVYGANGRLRWTKNFMHNLVKEACITFNDLVAEKFESYWFDFWAAFTTPASKQDGYDNMIGNFDLLLAPHAPGEEIPARFLNLPLPFFFTRDTGVALPTAALPYNDIRINITFRPWQELLVLENSSPLVGVNPYAVPIVGTDIATEPVMDVADVWANYAIVSNEERERMGCAPRDILIEQVQTAPRNTFNVVQNRQPHFDVRFSHSVKALFFGIHNTTHKNVRSNYTCASPVPGPNVDNYSPVGALDPIESATLTYENLDRLTRMGADYYSLVNPWYSAPRIPDETGYHMYSYSLSFFDVDPLGSTNYGKLTNVSITPYGSDGAVIAQKGEGAAGSGTDYPQSFEWIVMAMNTNIIRVSGGTVGFPVL